MNIMRVNAPYSEYQLLIEAVAVEDREQIIAILSRCSRHFGGDFVYVKSKIPIEVHVYDHPQNSSYVVLEVK